MGCVLFSRPEHDLTLAYLFAYSKELVNFSKQRGYNVIDKMRKEASKKNILKIMGGQKPGLVMFNGHGDTEIICGHDDEVIISKSENPEALKNTITYALSCSSAFALGPEAVKKGAKSFIGYEFDFALGRDPDRESTPLKDKIAKKFLEPSNILFLSLLKGNCVKESVVKAKKKMKENIDYLSVTNDFPEASHYAPFLYWNYVGLAAHGDEEAVFY